MSDEFEARFSDFLDSSACDLAEGALFSLLRVAFTAGWEAAGDEHENRERKAPAGRVTDFPKA